MTRITYQRIATTKRATTGAVFAAALACGGSSELDSAEIVTQCENAALRQIKSPSTAKFSTGNLSDNMVRRFPDGSMVVHDWFDAQNSFGAIVRASLVCHMRADASGSVVVDSLRITER